MALNLIRGLPERTVSLRDPVLWILLPLALALFLVDLQLPLGVAGGMPYVAVVLVAAWSAHPRMPLLVALICSILTIAGFFLSPPGELLWVAVVNRTLAVAAIWTVGALACVRRTGEIRRLEERRQSEEKLKRVNRELEAFAHTLSHDLRGYLTPIIGYADFLGEEYDKCLQKRGLKAVAEIENHGRHMLAFLEDLLDLARAGHLESPPAPVDVGKIVSELLGSLEEPIRREGVEVRCGSLPHAAIPETLLHQVFANLLGNALRYAGKKGSPLEIGGERQGGRVRFFVRDHGPGIPEAERERVFDVFYRGSTGKGVPGSGIGLATIRKIALLYQGNAWVEETPGGGSTFRIELSDAS